MKTGRNDPCPCGSGKKYKKCCLGKKPPAPPASAGPDNPTPAAVLPRPRAAAPQLPAAPPKPPPPPPDPAIERWNARWHEFESRDEEGQIALFLQTLDDPELMNDEMAFEMLGHLRPQAVKRGERARFAELVATLRARRPEVYAESGQYYLSWLLLDALAENRLDAVQAVTLELAPLAGTGAIDTVNRAFEALAYHGQLSVVVEALRVAWPGVKTSSDVVPWGIDAFAAKGADYEIFDYLEHTASPDPADAALLDRVKFFIDDPRPEYLVHFIGDLTGQTARTWKVDDFALKPRRKKGRDDRDDRRQRRPDPGAANLSRLIAEFVGYLRKVEGVPFPRGELVRMELYRYFLRRNEGDLDPQPGMLERAMHPNKTLPPPPRPGHPLCPERVTLDVFLGGLLDLFNGLHHTAAALFEAMPAWLRFLESRGLIDADRRLKTVDELRPLHATLLGLWKNFTDDPTLYRAAEAWPADAAKGPAKETESAVAMQE